MEGMPLPPPPPPTQCYPLYSLYSLDSPPAGVATHGSPASHRRSFFSAEPTFYSLPSHKATSHKATIQSPTIPPNKNTKKKCGEMLANSKKSANFALAKGPSGGMVDAHVSGACAARREGSSPFLGTKSGW